MICSSVCLLHFIVWQGQVPVRPRSIQWGNVTSHAKLSIILKPIDRRRLTTSRRNLPSSD
jgi:hypothetical protein